MAEPSSGSGFLTLLRAIESKDRVLFFTLPTPNPYSLLLTPYSLLPTPYSLLPHSNRSPVRHSSL
jgi:hypothetical protein